MTTRKGQGRVPVPSATTAPDPALEELLGKPGAEPSAPEPVAEPAETEPAARPRLTVYVDSEVQDAARAAIYWTYNKPEGYETLSDLVEAGILAIVADLQNSYNDGQPFDPIPAARRIRRGRPVRRPESGTS